MIAEIASVLEPEEKIIWQDVINRKVLFFQMASAFLAVILVSTFFFLQATVKYTSNNQPASSTGFNFGLIILAAGFVLSLLGFFSNYVKVYVITNKRLLIRSGLIGTDFNSIYFTEVKTADVNVGLIGKIFSVGTISIDTGKVKSVSSGNNNQNTNVVPVFDKLLYIDKPYEVYQYFQTTLSERQESLYSGRADKESTPVA